MRRLLFLLVILLISVWAGVTISRDPGYMLFVYRGWSMQMPLWFGLVATIILFTIIYFILRFIAGISDTWQLWKNWLQNRRKNKAYSKTNRGLIELLEGHWATAEVLLNTGVEKTDFPLINYLAAAKAAHEQGALDRRDKYLQKAHLVAPNADVAIGLTQAQLQLQQGQLEQAFATLTHLQSIAPRHELVLQLLQRLYIRLGDWQGLLNLLPALRKAKILNSDQCAELEIHIYQELLKATDNKAKNVEALRHVWQTVPGKIAKDPRVIYVYAKLLLQYSYTSDEVERLLTTALKKEWNKELVEQYGLLITSHPEKQLDTAEGWRKRYGNQAVLLLALGRISMRCQQWSKARKYFEDSLHLETSAETYAECGKLLEQLGDIGLAVQSYKDGLLTRNR